MEQDVIPDDVKQFILASVPTVSYLEAMLLLRMEPGAPWDARRLARRLYMNERAAAQLLQQLHAARYLETEQGQPEFYLYRPADAEMERQVARVAAAYARRLVEISNLIHTRNGRPSGTV